MQTQLSEKIQAQVEAAEIEKILRSCVHCGFCNATCPTYQITANELDGPRGRIYLLKQIFEGERVTQISHQHLDRCLSCQSCETTCPSGVEYGRLLDLGRVVVEERVQRPWFDHLKRKAILVLFTNRQRFKYAMYLARWFSPFLPRVIKHKIPVNKVVAAWTKNQHPRKVLILPGCVQPTLAPEIDFAAAKVLDKLGISLLAVESSNCCGALSHHLSADEKAKALARQNIDACWHSIEQGIEAITMTASGCGLALKEYATLLQYDKDYALKAQKFSVLVKDISEIVQVEDLSLFNIKPLSIAYQSPCTLQHGQQLAGTVEAILQKMGAKLVNVENTHLCCGSAGVYSLLQTELSNQLRAEKLNALLINQVDCIATANIGCLTHLQEKSPVKVMHWIELLQPLST